MSRAVDPETDDELDAGDDRDVAGNLEVALERVEPSDVPADAGHYGRLVGARCVACGVVRMKRAPEAKADPDEDRRESFKHVCHSDGCQKVTWWNILAVRGGAADGD